MSLKVPSDWWKTMFDEVYLITDARSVADDELTRKEVDLFRRLIPMKPSEAILDLCGGHGRHSLELCRRGFTHCTVFDYSQELLNIGARAAWRENLAVEFVQGDARHIPHAAGSYNHVLVLGNSLGYATEAEADCQILGEARRLLQPGGWLLIDVTDGSATRRNFSPMAWHEIGDDVVVCRQRELDRDVIRAREMVLDKRSGLVRDKNYRVRLYSAEQLEELMSRAGFQGMRRHEDFAPYQGEGDLGFMNHRMVITAQ